VLLTVGPGSVITVCSLSTHINLTLLSSALAMNSTFYPLSHMSMFQAPRYSCKKVNILGATLNQQVTFQDHVNTVGSAVFYHLRCFSYVRPVLTQDTAITLGSAVIGASILDYTLTPSFMAHLLLIINDPSVFEMHCASRPKRTPLAKRQQKCSPLCTIGCLFNIALAT